MAQLTLRKKRIGSAGIKLTYKCAGCGVETSTGTWGNAVISLVAGLVIVPVLAFVVQKYSLDTAPKGVFVAAAVLAGLGVYEIYGRVRFEKMHPTQT
jgi:hypothetical protein